MAVLRIQKKQQNFLIMDKSCLQEKQLSWGAKGLHAYLMSMKDDWRVQVENLQQCSTNGRDAVRGFLRELEKAGYIKKSLARNGSNGRFGGIEYLVLEVPDTQNHILPPATENLSSVPEPENPATGNPAPEKTTLISIKYNNYLNKQGLNKTAAIIKRDSKAEESFDNLNSAAVSHYPMIEKTRPSKPAISSVAICEEPNPLIGDSLTKPQQQRILKMIMSLNMPIKKSLNDEIEFCLLSPRQFTSCENNFAKKLNAIRKVILRGDWQTPVEMLKPTAIVQRKNPRIHKLEKERSEVESEASHFKRLLSSATEINRPQFERIIKKAENRMIEIEDELNQLLNERTNRLPQHN